MSRSRDYSKLFPQVKREDKYYCRLPECGAELSGRKRSFCGEACRDAALIQCWPTEQRRQTYRRDKGVCAGCGMDCDAAEARIRKALMDIRHSERYWHKPMAAFCQWLDIRQNHYGHTDFRSIWEANHIKAVSEGGDNTLDNLETLCIWCHRKHTKALRGRLSKRKGATHE